MHTLKGYCVFVSLLMGMAACAQVKKAGDDSREQLIAASQSGASPLFFDPGAKDVQVIQPLNFGNAQECEVRGGLPNFFEKAAAGKTVTIGYIGGSITQAVHGYRASSARFIQSMFPRTLMKAINAGVSGTGTDLGACRLREQLLQYRPDLVFIEFAVNGAYRDGLEGMIRQIWKEDPTIDICLLYTLFNGQSAIYASGKVPDNIAAFEAIATHYGIPGIHLGLQPAMLEAQGGLVWKSDSKTIQGKVVFSNDGIHPLPEGGDLYAGAIARSMQRMQQQAGKVPHTLPGAMIAANWEAAGMYAPEAIARFNGAWEKLDPSDSTYLKSFTGWFPYLLQGEQPGASFTFRFSGDMFGFFDIGGPEVGQLLIEVDGKPVRLSAVQAGTRVSTIVAVEAAPVNRFNSFCNNRYRGQFECIRLAPGEHTVTVTISPDKADKRTILGEKQLQDITANPRRYDRTVFYLGKILLNGKPL
ncbi:SGNH/GDSL hydrolase family protein [Paraflavitalea sp. CAU 1676]|uniref:SGNH/GDSL hydrolase family protein n=1 Tax=Paraflavitalea sp. CAU 1676 TaxID=3032598 RepID=UPI0023DA1869|nr:SGNH/GDSL hydrolase family protein [Paraflavitalea sp. CAU 1676]MDF2192708.1 SGNH/GDSL hydrolase family protein [Paraflavitalea sp. CAU 1676]